MNIQDRLEKLADSFKGSSGMFGAITVTNIGCGILRVDGKGFQGEPGAVFGWLKNYGIK